MNRRHLWLAAALSIVLATTACSSSGGKAADGTALQTVKMGYIGDFNGSSLLAVANTQGMWKEHGLSVKASVFTNGPLQIQALGTGDLDFGYIGPGAMWLPASGKAKVIAINTLGGADRVIAQPGITTLAQLKGKKIGIPQGTSGDMILTLALQSIGLSKSDVKIVNMDPATLVSAFSAKQIDAAGFYYPAIATIKTKDPNLVELAKDSDFANVMAFPTAFVAGNDVVTKQKDKTTKFLAVLREAIAYRAAHPTEAIADDAKLLGVTVAQVTADAANSQVLTLDQLDTDTTDGTIDKWLTAMNSFFIGSGQLTSATAENPSVYYTGSLFTAAGQ